MLLGMVLETLGIGLVMPALAALTQTDLVATYPFLELPLRTLGQPSQAQLVVFGVLVLVGVYAIKTLFLGFLAWAQMHFAYGVRADVSQRLFEGYLRQPYTFHLERNSAQLLRNIIAESDLFAHNGLYSGLLLLAEGLVIVGILALLVAVEPFGAVLVVTALGGAAWAFYRLTRRRVLRWGEARQHHEGLRIQHLQQGLGGAKDVKLLGREDDFLAQYHAHNAASARVAQHQATLQQIPRLWLELLAVIGLAAVVLSVIGQGKPLDQLVPTLGLFAAAAFRLMPSINRVIGASQRVRYTLPVINTLYHELHSLETPQMPEHVGPIEFRSALVLDKISFRYPAAEVSALSDISIRIPVGACVGFIGGSGAGKSTLVDLVLGLLTPSSGTIAVDGVDIQSRLRGWQDQIGYVPQTIFLTDDTVRRNVAFGLADDKIDEAAVGRALKAAQLEDFVESLQDGVETVVGERGVRLSGGQRQRIGIARALYHDPAVLVLDEATSALDAATELGVMQSVLALQSEKTILIVAHRLSTVARCDWLYRLEHGRVVEEGAPSTILPEKKTAKSS